MWVNANWTAVYELKKKKKKETLLGKACIASKPCLIHLFGNKLCLNQTLSQDLANSSLKHETLLYGDDDLDYESNFAIITGCA